MLITIVVKEVANVLHNALFILIGNDFMLERWQPMIDRGTRDGIFVAEPFSNKKKAMIIFKVFVSVSIDLTYPYSVLVIA